MFKTQLSMFNLPNLFTACNLLCGILSILLSLNGRIDFAAYFIFGGLLFDYFDGFIARLLKQQGELGKQLDSLADMVTFGVAPGVMMMVILCYSLTELIGAANPAQAGMCYFIWMGSVLDGNPSSWLPFVALFIPFMSMFRLAKFNLDTRQTDKFIGLPTPANSIFFTSFPLLIVSDFKSDSWQQTWMEYLINPYLLVPLIIVMSLLLVSELPLFALKFKHFRFKGNEIRYLFLITCSLLIPFFLVWSIPIIVILYLILSLIDTFLKKSEA